MKDSDKLLRAAELVERGWCKGALARTEDGRVIGTLEVGAASFCVLGACDVVGVDTYDVWDVLPVAPDRWNDERSRTQDDAICALHAAAVLAMSEGR